MEKVPFFLEKKLINQYGEVICESIIKGYSQKRKVSLRVNSLKSNAKNVQNQLTLNNIEFKKSDFWENAFIIENVNEDIIRTLDIYKNGEIYLQNLSSMLPPIILDPKENEDILDMTAAPGSKTTEMAMISNNKAHITACEMNKIRFDRLMYNLEKQGAKCVYAMQKDARQIDDFFSFDKILLDAPCSGSGTINTNDINLNKYFTEKLIEKSIKTQKALINKAIKVLKEGGELVYSTCSVLQEENENIIKDLLNQKNIELINIDFEKYKLPILPTKIKGTICIMPTDEYEGFFVAKIRKK